MRGLVHAMSNAIAGEPELRKFLYDLVVDVIDAFDANDAVEVEGALLAFENRIAGLNDRSPGHGRG